MLGVLGIERPGAASLVPFSVVVVLFDLLEHADERACVVMRA